jgi:hypothetical protein
MRRIAGSLLVLLSLPLMAKDRPRAWQDAVVLASHSDQHSVTTAVAGNTSVTSLVTTTYFDFATDSTIYEISCIVGQIAHRCPNVTLNGRTKIAVESRNLRILEDDGHEVKFPILSKQARNPQ